MRRLLVILVVLAGGAAALAASGAGREGDRSGRFTVELDNAFGLVEGGDLKIAGVRAGTITGLRVGDRAKRALVDFEITKRGFGSLRADATCDSRPQSLIGEYFLDCQPGRARRELRAGATIPVERTTSTIPLDLLNNVLRRPYRERLRIILDEIGAGVGARDSDLNEAVRRLSPALRETDKVLAKLGRQNETLAQLTEDADTVIADLAGNRRDVGRWVVETRDTATASAERRRELAAGFARLPGFLRELRPTMAELGRVADGQTPALRDLDASAGELEELLSNLGPFAESTRVNVRSLAGAARTGRSAVRAAAPSVAELSRAAAGAPELAKNLAIVLEDLDDRGRAAEPDPRSPGGKGYTGLEAIMQYAFDQSQSVNIYDDNGYILKVNAFEDKCSEFQNEQTIKEEEERHPGFIDDCGAYLGPNQPGVLQPDPTASRRGPSSARRRRAATRERTRDRRRRPRERGGSDRPRDDRPRDEQRPGGSQGPGLPQTPALPDVPDILDELLPPTPAVPPLPGADPLKTDRPILDFLFGP